MARVRGVTWWPGWPGPTLDWARKHSYRCVVAVAMPSQAASEQRCTAAGLWSTVTQAAARVTTLNTREANHLCHNLCTVLLDGLGLGQIKKL